MDNLPDYDELHNELESPGSEYAKEKTKEPEPEDFYPHDREMVDKIRLAGADVQSAVDRYRKRPDDDRFWQVVFAVDQFSGMLGDMIPGTEEE